MLTHLLEWALYPGSFQSFLAGGFLISLFTTIPATSGIIVAGYWLDRSDLEPTRYERIAKWTAGGLLVFLGINILIINAIFLEFFPADRQASLLVGWVRFAMSLGAACGLFIGIVEARAIERALDAERATMRAAELEHQTDQLEFFNSILRHDVLNGMTVIRSRAEFLDDDLTDETQRRHADTILRWSDDIVLIIQRVRRILDTLTESAEFVPTATDLASVVGDEVDRISATYPTVEFETEVPEGLFVAADDLLGEVIGNLLTNAVEHNDQEGLTVTTSATAEGDTVTIRIADTGRGVPDDLKTSIFRRGETGRGIHAGTGFGLFFIDSMLSMYGGQIHVEDNDPHGAVFVVELPRATQTQPAKASAKSVSLR
ncbi:ATP-binding protein [Haladaptatus sp. GCM10025707]